MTLTRCIMINSYNEKICKRLNRCLLYPENNGKYEINNKKEKNIFNNYEFNKRGKFIYNYYI